jgi:D-serine dehydratase
MRKARAEKLSQNAWFPQVRDLLAVLEEGQWLAPGMQYVSDMIEHIQAKDAQDLIYSIWRLVRFASF